MTRNENRFVEATLVFDALNHYRAVLADEKVAKNIIETHGEEFYSDLQKAYFKLCKKYEKKFIKLRVKQ